MDPAAAAAHLASERPRLFALAYRMLGTASDAEDVLQDAFLRAEAVEDARAPGALLTTIVVRLCLDHLKSARRQRETYVGPWLPEPIATDDGTFDRDSVGAAFLVLLEALTPEERAVYVLHEIFDYPHEEIARLLEKQTGTCRQLLRRAKLRVGERRTRFYASPRERDRIVGTFLEACLTGRVEAMATLLADDVRATADGGGKATAARKVVTGRPLVAKFLVGLAKRASPAASLAIAELNGAIGVLIRIRGAVVTTITLELDAAGRIADVGLMRNPDKLARLPAG